MTLITSLVVGANAVKEFQLLLHTLEQWEPTAEVFAFTDTPTSLLIRAIKSRIRFEIRVELNAYTGLTRKDMEARSGIKYATLWHEFMMEKARVIQWVFEVRPNAAKEGVWFLDADICLLAPLPTMPPQCTLAVSPHYIKAVDEARFGKYNGGFVWMRDPSLLDVWKRATYGSRFYEQAALESIVATVTGDNPEKVTELPIQNNFGWWRYLQSADAPPTIQGRLGYNRTLPGCGLTYEGQVLKSLHTHWYEINEFNAWIRGRLEFLAKAHAPAKMLVQHLNRLFPITTKK